MPTIRNDYGEFKCDGKILYYNGKPFTIPKYVNPSQHESGISLSVEDHDIILNGYKFNVSSGEFKRENINLPSELKSNIINMFAAYLIAFVIFVVILVIIYN